MLQTSLKLSHRCSKSLLPDSWCTALPVRLCPRWRLAVFKCARWLTQLWKEDWGGCQGRALWVTDESLNLESQIQRQMNSCKFVAGGAELYYISLLSLLRSTLQSARLQLFDFFPSQLSALTGFNTYKGFVGHPRARAPNACFHRGPDPRGMPVSSLSLSLGQQEAGSCYTTVNNTINSPWLINWLQTNPAASLCTLLCVTSLSCLSSSHCHVHSAAVL